VELTVFAAMTGRSLPIVNHQETDLNRMRWVSLASGAMESTAIVAAVVGTLRTAGLPHRAQAAARKPAGRSDADVSGYGVTRCGRARSEDGAEPAIWGRQEARISGRPRAPNDSTRMCSPFGLRACGLSPMPCSPFGLRAAWGRRGSHRPGERLLDESDGCSFLGEHMRSTPFAEAVAASTNGRRRFLPGGALTICLLPVRERMRAKRCSAVRSRVQSGLRCGVLAGIGLTQWACGHASDDDPASRRSATRAASGGYVKVALPEGVSISDLKRPSLEVRARLAAAVEKRRQREPMGSDVVVFTDASGRPVLPDLEERPVRTLAQTLAANELNFTFNSPTTPFTPQELAQVQSWVTSCYPVAKTAYGSPAFANTVNISKGNTGGFAGFYFASSNEIVLGVVSADVLCHEMLHAFHDDFILFMSIWEEGMTRSAEIEVLKRAGLPQVTSHEFEIDIHYEEFNQPTVGGVGGSFPFPQWVQSLLRYQLGGYAWGKPMLETSTFLADFNSAVYAQASTDIGVLGSPSQLIEIAAGVKPTVEDLPTATYFSQQHVLGTSPPAGNFVYLRASYLNPVISLFSRDSFGGETNLAGVTVQYSFLNHAGAVLASGSDVTSDFGVLLPTRFSGYQGRVLWTASATISGALVTSSAYLTGVVDEAQAAGVFGIVEGADTGSIRFEPLDQAVSPLTVAVSQGAFFAPTLRAVQGRIRYVFTSSGGVSSSPKVFTKDDEAPYFVHARLAAPSTTPCVGLCQNPVQFTAPFSTGNLGSGATCHETTSNLVNGVCANFANGRTLRINGVETNCSAFTLPAKRNGGYCFQASPGDQPYAFFAVW
jgi:hypothetical protein